MGSRACSCIFYTVTALQVVLAAVIVALVATRLDDVHWQGGKIIATKATCTLGVSFNSASLCVYVYVVAGVSLAVSLTTALLSCLTCNMCGLGKYLHVMVSSLGTVWWVIAAALVQKNVNDAAAADLSLQSYRTAVVAMMWVEVGLFGLLVLSGIFWVCSSGMGRGYDRHLDSKV